MSQATNNLGKEAANRTKPSSLNHSSPEPAQNGRWGVVSQTLPPSPTSVRAKGLRQYRSHLAKSPVLTHRAKVMTTAVGTRRLRNMCMGTSSNSPAHTNSKRGARSMGLL